MSDQASRLRQVVSAGPPSRAGARQGPVSIRPRGETDEGHPAATAPAAASGVGGPPASIATTATSLAAATITAPASEAVGAPGPELDAVPAIGVLPTRSSHPASLRPPSRPWSAMPAAGVGAIAPTRPRLARAVAIASGKGGVGKTSVAASLAVALARGGRATWLVDGDLGLGNVDVACGITPRWTLADVLRGSCGLEEALEPVEPSLHALAAGSGIAGLAAMPAGARERFVRLLAEAEAAADELVVDCGAGVGPTVLGFAASAEDVLVVATPEPASIVDAYGLVKCVTSRRPAARLALVVNQVEDPGEAAAVHRRIDAVARAHLGRGLPLAGAIPRDEAVRRAARARRPVVLAEPEAPAARAILALASRLLLRGTRDGGSAGTGADATVTATAAAPAVAAASGVPRGVAVPAHPDLHAAAWTAPPAQTDRDDGGFLGRVAAWLAGR